MTIEWDNDNCLGQTAKVVFQIPIALGQGKQFGTMVILVQGLQNGALTIEYFIDNRMGQRQCNGTMTIETDNDNDWVIDEKWDNGNRMGK